MEDVHDFCFPFIIPYVERRFGPGAALSFSTKSTTHPHCAWFLVPREPRSNFGLARVISFRILLCMCFCLLIGIPTGGRRQGMIPYERPHIVSFAVQEERRGPSFLTPMEECPRDEIASELLFSEERTV